MIALAHTGHETVRRSDHTPPRPHTMDSRARGTAHRPCARARGRLLLEPDAAVAALVAAILAAALNFRALDRLGYANDYYAAAVRRMLLSWHNFFYVSFDPGGFISIDKPPLGFWLQAASAELLGYSGVSLLLPEALAGVLAVAVLYRLVARAWGCAAGLLAALALAVTPVSVVVARDNGSGSPPWPIVIRH